MPTTLPELPWIAAARADIGRKEIPGGKHNPWIVGLWPAIGVTWFDTDEVPWCAGAVNYWLKKGGRPPLKPAVAARALAFKDYGIKLSAPAYGCIVVFSRDGGGHVGFVVGIDQQGNLMVLGGNQGNMVKISPFSRDRVVAYRWPSIYPDAGRFKLPLLTSDGKLSTNEA
jgi:uncharacterized protein (TIGR02594 family)